MPYGQSCYSFHANAKTFHQAQEICKKKGKVLVEIETQEENDMISELLFQSSLTSTKLDQVVIKWFIFLNTLGKLGGLLLIWLRSSSFSPSEIHGQGSKSGAAPEQHT